MVYTLDPAKRTLGGLLTSAVANPGHPGGIITLSAHGKTPGTGIIWGAIPTANGTDGAWHAVTPGALVAVDASDISKTLWKSSQNAARDGLGNIAKFCSPVVANGHVYMATFSNALRVYGLLN